MNVTYAQFNIEYKKKMYSVQLGLQYIQNNKQYCVAHVMQHISGARNVILTSSVSGRQIMNPSYARTLLREALKSEGIIKPAEVIGIDDPRYNSHRRRYYGLRKGDIVSSDMHNIKRAEVAAYGTMDNNAVYIREIDESGTWRGAMFEAVAEWCKIITKVEDLPK